MAGHLKYVPTATLWRMMAGLKRNRERMEDTTRYLQQFDPFIGPFKYHEKIREIMGVIHARAVRKGKAA